MTELKKRILKTLVRFGLYVAPQLLGKPYSEKLSSTTVTGTRKTQRTQRTIARAVVHEISTLTTNVRKSERR